MEKKNKQATTGKIPIAEQHPIINPMDKTEESELKEIDLDIIPDEEEPEAPPYEPPAPAEGP